MASEGQRKEEEKGRLLTTTLKYKEEASGMLVGQCREFPFIIVKGKTVNELGRYVKRHIDVYFKTFPEEAKKIIQTHEIHPEESENEWKRGQVDVLRMNK